MRDEHGKFLTEDSFGGSFSIKKDLQAVISGSHNGSVGHKVQSRGNSVMSEEKSPTHDFPSLQPKRVVPRLNLFESGASG